MTTSSRTVRLSLTISGETVEMEIAILALADSHGYAVVARDGFTGTVESPLFPDEADQPSHLLVRFRSDRGERLIALPLALVREVDVRERRVLLGVSRSEVAELPQHHPLIAPNLPRRTRRRRGVRAALGLPGGVIRGPRPDG